MSPDGRLTFGPPGNQWVYDKSTRTYDLTRGSNSNSDDQSPPSSPLRIQTTRGPPDTNILISPPLTALVVIDMQNFFLHPSCRAHPSGLAAVDPLLAAIRRCRRLGIQVVWLNWGLTDADLAVMPAGVSRGFARDMITTTTTTTTAAGGTGAGAGAAAATGLGVDLGGSRGRCLVAGEWNADVYGPLGEDVQEGDVHCAKNRMSGLWCEGQPLWSFLKGEEEEEEGVQGEKKTLLFAGVNTDQCVLGTLADAYNAGWDCVMVEDCCATTTEGAREVCLANVGNNYGFVIDSRTLAEASC